MSKLHNIEKPYQIQEALFSEGDEKSPEEILMGLKQMAMGDLERISDYANMILERLNKGEELSSWMYSQITLAVDQLNSVHDSLDGKDGVKESVNEAEFGEKIQKLNNRITKLRGDLARATTDNQKNVLQARLKNALQSLSDTKKSLGIKAPHTESVKEGKYYVTYNRGRGQGKGLEMQSDPKTFKSTGKPKIFSSYNDAKKYAEKMEKIFQHSIGGGTAYWVSDEKMNPIKESVNEGNFGEIDIMAREARNFNEFVKEFYKEFRDFPKDKDTLKWLKSLYDGRSKDESVNEVGTADWHFKAIKQLWDKSSAFTRKKIAALITKNPNSIWDKIAKELGASDYDDVSYYTDMLHLESKDGLERVAQGLPQTEEEPINEWKAEEVLHQLGGRRFIAMTGAKNFVKNDPKKQITFKIGGGAKGGINYVRITLTSMDLYNIEFLKARGTDLKVVAMEKGVYNDQLQQMFTKHTGMHTRL